MERLRTHLASTGTVARFFLVSWGWRRQTTWPCSGIGEAGSTEQRQVAVGRSHLSQGRRLAFGSSAAGGASVCMQAKAVGIDGESLCDGTLRAGRAVRWREQGRAGSIKLRTERRGPRLGAASNLSTLGPGLAPTLPPPGMQVSLGQSTMLVFSTSKGQQHGSDAQCVTRRRDREQRGWCWPEGVQHQIGSRDTYSYSRATSTEKEKRETVEEA